MGNFSEASQWERGEGDVHWGSVSEDWLQGRAGFGGLVSAGALRAMEALVEDGRSLRSALVNFVGPASPGPIEARPRLLRAGRTLTQVGVEVWQGDRLRTVMNGVFGGERSTRIPLDAPPAPEANPPEDCLPMPYLEGMTPKFTQHFDYRWAEGGFPFSGSKEGHIRGWIRPHGGGKFDSAMVLALLDAWPPPLWPMAKRPVAGSTASWQVNVYNAPDGQEVGWCLYDARVSWSKGGFSDFEGKLWGADGELIATSRQLFIDFSGG